MAQQTEFIPYGQALALKELGFDEPCFAWYNDNGNYMLGIDEVRFDTKNTYHFNNTDSVSAPLYQQAFRWFRKKYKDVFYIKMSGSYTYYINLNQKLIGEFETYEEAENFLINELLNISNYGQSNT